jgi:hypothetical protein
MTKTARFSPTTGLPEETVEQQVVTEDIQDATSVMASRETAAVTAVTTTQTQTNQDATTTTLATAQTDTTTEKTTIEKAADVDNNSRLGAGVTSAARPALTYDVIKFSKISLAGMVEGDLAKKKLSAVGAGINADVAKNGRYFAGVYGVYEFEKKSTGARAMIGMRF